MINNNNTKTNTNTNKEESNAPVSTGKIAPGELITSLYVLEDEDFTYDQNFGFPVRIFKDGRRVNLYRAYEGEDAYKNGPMIGENSCYTQPLEGENAKYRVLISNYAVSSFANGSGAGVFRQKDISHDNPLMVKDSTITSPTGEPLMVKDSTITAPDKDKVHVGMAAVSKFGTWAAVKSFDLV